MPLQVRCSLQAVMCEAHLPLREADAAGPLQPPHPWQGIAVVPLALFVTTILLHDKTQPAVVPVDPMQWLCRLLAARILDVHSARSSSINCCGCVQRRTCKSRLPWLGWDAALALLSISENRNAAASRSKNASPMWLFRIAHTSLTVLRACLRCQPAEVTACEIVLERCMKAQRLQGHLKASLLVHVQYNAYMPVCDHEVRPA